MWFLSLAALAAEPDPSGLLATWKTPDTWTQQTSPGNVTFLHASDPHNYGGGVKVDLSEGGLDALRARWGGSHTVTVEDTTIDGRPALKVHHPNFRPEVVWDGYYVVDARGELLEFAFRAVIPEPERAAFLATVRLLDAPSVPAGATFEVSGTVGIYTGNCQPVAVCVPTPVSTEIRFRRIEGAGVAGPVVATARSDAQGHYSVTLPPGRYSVVPMDAGEEMCRSTGPVGPCGIHVVDRALTYDPRIDRAAW